MRREKRYKLVRQWYGYKGEKGDLIRLRRSRKSDTVIAYTTLRKATQKADFYATQNNWHVIVIDMTTNKRVYENNQCGGL